MAICFYEAYRDLAPLFIQFNRSTILESLIFIQEILVRIGNFSAALLWALLFLAGIASALAAPANEPPRQLTERGLENLTAFTRLLGYARFFHPSDQPTPASGPDLPADLRPRRACRCPSSPWRSLWEEGFPLFFP
jgi:hypothetical protein